MTTEREFKSFIRILPDCEVLDVSAVTGQRRTDFLLNSRTIAADLKLLEEDLAQKVGKLLNDNGIIFYGRRPFNSLIAGRPDAEALNKKAFNLVTTSLESHFRHANKQILSTVRGLQLKDTLGLVIVINNGNLALEPHVVVKAASRLLMKQSNSKTKFSAIHGCLYVCENHSPRNMTISNQKVLPALIIVATGGQPYDALSDYMNKLIESWCAFRGISYIDGESRTDLL